MKSIKENLLNNVNTLLNKVQVILSNKIVITIFLIVQGITFIVNPNNSMLDLAKSVSVYVFLATSAILINYIVTKKINMSNLKQILISVILFILSIICYIFPEPLSEYVKFCLCMTIIINSIVNILDTLKLDKISNLTIKMKNDISDLKNSDDIKTIQEGIENETSKVSNSITNLTKNLSKFSIIFVIVNCLAIFLGLFVLIFDMKKNQIGIQTIGVILIISGVLDLFVAIKSYVVYYKGKLINKNKEKYN